MAIYRCPACGEIVPRENARRCLTCGLHFDLDHEPVPDDGSGKPEWVRKKEKRGEIIVIVFLVLAFVGAILFAIGNGIIFFEHYRNWHP